MEGVLSHIRKNEALTSVYSANLIVAAHFFLVVYINSSTLGRFFTDKQIGLFFMIGSLVSTALFLAAPKILSTIGAFRYFLITLLLELVAITGLAYYDAKIGTILFFILHQASVPMLSFILDIFFETVSKQENETGELRGIYLSLANLMLVIAPAIVGFVLLKTTFHYVYLLSAILLLPLFVISLAKLRKIHLVAPQKIGLKKSFQTIWDMPDLRFGILAHFILQFFYAWMIIYLPLYLTQTIGFSWTELGAIFTIMLLPFLLFEVPVGWLADKKFGEKELMILGFSIMTVATACLFIPKTPSFWVWASILFLSRVGASIVEITTESYFFKHTKGKNADLISIFRMTRPISYLIAPLVAILSLSLMDLGQAFWILSIVTVAGSIFAFQITDTR